MYAALCARILSGHAVSVEELVDLETLKLNVNDRAGDFAAALDVLVRAKVSRVVPKNTLGCGTPRAR